MAFEKTKARYASFGVATSLPSELIDTFWDILDNYLRNVVPLDNILRFKIIKSEKGISYEYHDSGHKLLMVFDYKYSFDPFFPEYFYIVDNHGKQTILLAHELND